MDRSLFDRFQRVLTASSVEELREQIQGIIECMGFEHYMFLLSFQDPVQADGFNMYSLGTYPEAWLKRYAERSYHLVDPTAIHIRQHYYPLPWKNETFAEPGAWEMYEEAKSFGISAGVTCPVVTRQAGLAGFGYAKRGDADLLYDESVRSVPAGYLLGGYLHERLNHLLALRPEPSFTRLTNREIQCLNLSAQGFADAELAWRLGVNIRTVRFHLMNVRKKLGASTRVQMISRGMELNLIGL